MALVVDKATSTNKDPTGIFAINFLLLPWMCLAHQPGLFSHVINQRQHASIPEQLIHWAVISISVKWADYVLLIFVQFCQTELTNCVTAA
jgi:hypothetical protein